MIVIKDLRVDVLGEPIFEKVNLVIRSGERIGVLGTNPGDVTAFLRTLLDDADAESGTVTREGERCAYISPEDVEEGYDAVVRALHSKPTFLFLDAQTTSSAGVNTLMRLVRGFKGGLLVASENAELMQMAKVTRMLEVRAFNTSVTSYTGTYEAYVVEREKDLARVTEAYDRQQREKKRLEEWLENKQAAAALNRSPQNGNTIRTKKKYLKREILDKQISRPPLRESEPDTEEVV